jgi:hypothetical protein
MSELPNVEAPQEKAFDPKRQPTARSGEQSSTRRQTKMVPEEDPAHVNAKIAQGEENIPICCSIDRLSENSEDDSARINSTTGSSRSGTILKFSTDDEGDQRGFLAANAGEETPIALAHTYLTTARQVPDIITASQSARKDSRTATRRLTSSVKRMKTRNRSSAVEGSRAPTITRTPTRTATIS